ncbi:MAG: acetyl-CoA carboxylase biotin carboxyl carrier protein, partial [Alicyclobacillus sp.]|nr:acetyl-CoA carboxylase biotin carboxyl carrier protein [Alicyclobacillus sp.]
LIRLLDETSLSELRLETDDMKLHLKKPEPPTTAAVTGSLPVYPAADGSWAQSVPAPAAEAPPTVAVRPAPAAVASAATPQSPAEPAENMHVVRSPMVGTFYRAPAPDAPPYVEVGSRVTEKTVVCIVEAMKLMNEIEAEVTGEVVAVLAENGQLVEYGQPLFHIKRA